MTARLAPALALVLAACQGASAPAPDPTPAPTPTPTAGQALVPGPEHDVGSPGDVAVALSPDGGGWKASAPTHDARIADGVAVVTAHLGATATPLALETTQVERGDGELVPAIKNEALTGGDLAIDRGVAVEHFKNRVDGLEQSWTFAGAPDGQGDLVVTVVASGPKFVASTASGLHFANAGEPGYRYGKAVWQDAAGKEYEIAPTYQDGRILITVPESVLETATFPATLDPTVSAEVAVDSSVVGYTGVGTRNPAIAFDGTNYLVVWQDDRDDSKNPDIWGTRVSQAGAVLDATNIKIAATAGVQNHPTVVWTGSTYVVAWEDFLTPGGTQADIKAATVSSAGVVAQLGAVASTSNSETVPKLASNGAGNALLVYQSGANASGDVYGAVFSGGAFGAPFAIAATAAAEFGPNVGSNPAGNYLVAWSLNATNADLQGVQVTTAGALSGAAFTISAGAGQQALPSISFDGTNFDVSWSNNNAGLDIYGTRVSTAGAVLDVHTEGTNTMVGGKILDNATGSQDISTISCTSAGCLLTFQDTRNNATTSTDVYGRLVTTSFTTPSADFAISNANLQQQVPAAIAAAGGYFAVWGDLRDDGASAITGARITSAGAVTDANGIVLARGNAREVAPRFGNNGAYTLVAWTDSRNYGTDIYGVRFNSNGAKLDSTAVALTNAVASQITPAVAQVGSSFYAVWSDARSGTNRDIYASRLNTTGGTLDPSGIAITTAATDQLLPDVATGPGGTALVVWQDRRNGNFDIYGALVNSSGVPTVSDIVISNAANDQTAPSVAYDPTNNVFLVIWSDARTSTTFTDLYGARVSAAGAVLDAGGVAISTAAGSQLSPDLTYGNGEFFAVWEDRRTDTQGDIYGARITAAGSISVLDANAIAISTGAQQQHEAVAAPLSNGFGVAWVDNRNAATSGTDIYGGQVSTAGVVTGSDFVISANPENEDQVDATNVNGVMAVTYTRAAPATDTVRVETRRITFGGSTGGTCTQNSQCSTGFCSDGYCCDTACGNNSQTDCQACAYSKTLKPNGTCSPIAAGTICRNYANTFCDLREYCDGTNTACPPDVGRNAGLVCNSTTGSRCPANDVSGAPHICP